MRALGTGTIQTSLVAALVAGMALTAIAAATATATTPAAENTADSAGSDPALIRARELVREGRPREAVALLRTRLGALQAAAKDAPQQAARDAALVQRLHALLGDTYLMLDEPEAALRHIEVVARAHPDASEPRFKQGLALARRSATLPDAIAAFQMALDLGHPAGRAHARIGACYKALAERADPDPASAPDSDGSQPLRWRASAQEHLRRAVDADPAHATALSQLADLVALDGRHAEALALYERLEQTDSGRPETLARLGSTWLRLGRPDRARDYLERSLKRIHAIEDGAGIAQGYVYREVRARAHLDLADALLAAGHPDVAREHLEQVAAYGDCEQCDANGDVVSAASRAARQRLDELARADGPTAPDAQPAHLPAAPQD